MAFSLSVTPTTTLFPHTTLTTKGLRSSRTSRIVAQSFRDDLAKKYEKVVKDLEPIANSFLESRMKRTVKRLEYVAAREEAKMAGSKWEMQKQEVSFLQGQLGISVDKDEVFLSLVKTYHKIILVELEPAEAKYEEAKKKRMKMGMKDESAGEMSAWESLEKKNQELLEVTMKMYILRPGFSFET